MGLRTLFIIFAVIGIWLIGRHLIRSRIERKPEQKQIDSQNMVACQICGLHVPQDEAIYKNGQYFCSQDHADQAD